MYLLIAPFVKFITNISLFMHSDCMLLHQTPVQIYRVLLGVSVICY